MKRPYHTACPICRSRGRDTRGDNLYCYEDGHDHCFSCGYWNQSSVKNRIKPDYGWSKNNITLPIDSCNEFPTNVLVWLSSYEITSAEVKKFNMKWSPRLQWLIFPIHGDSNNELLLGYQARNFSGSGSKYWTRGSFDFIVNYYHQKNLTTNVILVEDMISAIKISRQFTAMPLFGSFLSEERARKLKLFFEELTFWLDYDKAVEAIKQATKFKQHGFRTSVVITPKDPKEYPDSEIKEIIQPEIS